VTGRHADFSPGSGDLAILTKVIHAIQATPCPEAVKMLVERRWQSVAEDVSPMAGAALLHTDLNEDNLIITPANRAYVVDWAFVARGAAWVELGLLIPWLLKADHSPRETDEWVSQFSSWADADPAHIDLFSAVYVEKWRDEPGGLGPPARRAHQAMGGLSAGKIVGDRVDAVPPDRPMRMPYGRNRRR
jgi:Ser/Thr protein kinase RdoA (MazF antagonist)